MTGAMFPAEDTRPRCPYCRSLVDATTPVAGAEQVPTEGSVGICLYCMGVAIFTGDGLHKRKPTREELLDIMADDGVIDALRRLAAWPDRPTM